ncbi:MAG: Gfo/Idh/MocA family oxidoreductase, partial [Akkermansiaceae bacterium]|nr:Gfo/Idh/MocA family oxidoreductase [Akkermansiaceae bacterium]
MNFGIIGTGMIARIHPSAISAIAGSRLHSVCNHRLAGAANLAADYQIPAFDDLQRFLSDPSLDIVTICTPSGAHFEP